MKINNSISLNIQFIVLFLIVLLTNCKKEDNTNYLNNWQTIYQDTTVWMTNINFLDKNTGFVLANNTNAIGSLRGRQFIIKTINAGQTWVKYACLLPTGNDVIGDIFPLNSTTLIGLGTSVYKSIDNGLNWINLYPTHNIGCGVWDMYMKDSVNWQLADCAFITQTTDGGKSWRRTFVKDTFPVPVSHISFPSNKVGYACGGGSWDYSQFGFIIKTTDGGSNWDYINPEPWYSQNETFPDVGNIQFITEQTGFIFTDDGRLCKTIDGGNN